MYFHLTIYGPSAGTRESLPINRLPDVKRYRYAYPKRGITTCGFHVPPIFRIHISFRKSYFIDKQRANISG